MPTLKSKSRSGTGGQAPKKSDRKVNSFVSALRVTYEAIKLYRSLLVAVVGLVGVVTYAATQFSLSFWVAASLSAIPAISAFLWLLPVWHEARTKREAEKRNVRGEIKHPDFFRLTPLEENQSFGRADLAHETVYSWVVESSAPLLYLCGASGSGKSSIIQAWVIPRVVSAGNDIRIISVRVSGDPDHALRASLLRRGVIWDRPPTDLSYGAPIESILTRAAKKMGQTRLLIALDQFEEFLILSDIVRRDAFTSVLARLANGAIPNLQLLMILRSDYRPLLDLLGLPSAIGDTKEVPPFLERDALKFLRSSGLILSPEMEGEIRDEARDVEQTPGLIRPITINLFGLVLRSFEDVPKSFRRGALLRSHLLAILNKPLVRDYSSRILRCMLTSNGTKKPTTCDQIGASVGLTPGQVRGYLLMLADDGIVRELDAVSGTWEIAHDFIAGLYFQILARLRESLMRRIRPWVLFGGAILWASFAIVFLAAIPISQELSNQNAMTDAGFTRIACVADAFWTPEPNCQHWIAPATLNDKMLDELMPKLAKIKHLQALTLRNSEIADGSRLAALTSLQFLDLSNTKIKDLRFVNNIHDIRVLDISKTQADGLLGPDTIILPELRVLKDGGSNIRTFNFLKKSENLKYLDLNDSKIEDLSFMNDYRQIKHLYVANTLIQDLIPLSRVQDLHTLVADGTKIGNIEPIGQSLALETLVLNSTSVNDISVVRKLRNLKTLKIGRTLVSEIAALSALYELQTLDLNKTAIRDLAAIAGLNSLEHLYVAETEIQDIGSLGSLAKLRTLVLDRTAVNDINIISKLSALETLVLAYTKIKDISPLSALTNLRKLDLKWTSVKRLEPLNGMKKLETLDVSNTSITDFRPLIGCTSLSLLVLPGRSLDEADIEVTLGQIRKTSPNIRVYRGVYQL